MRQAMAVAWQRLRKKLMFLAVVLGGALLCSVVLYPIAVGVLHQLPPTYRDLLELHGGPTEMLASLRNKAASIPLLTNQWLFMAAEVVQVLLAPIPGTVLGLAAGFLFGFWKGLALSMVALTIGTALAMGIGRLFGERAVRRFVPQRLMERFDDLVQRGGLWGFFMIFLLPALPDDAVCFLAGLSRLSLWRLVAVAMVGRLPGHAVLTFVGATADKNAGTALSVFVVGMALAAVVWLFEEEILVLLRRFMGQTS
jgi:uncharacterized membrane protein YdjX (TVP38/TMEM64 family)